MSYLSNNKKDIAGSVLIHHDIKRLDIIRLAKDQKLNEDCYSNASYDLRLGNEYWIPSNHNDGNVFHNSGEKVPYLCSDNNNVLKIPAFTSIVFSTYEKVKMPNNVAGRFDLRVKWALQGLILQVGTQIEPGYSGKLFGLLHNFSKKEILIPTKSRLLTAEFYYTTGPALPAKVKDCMDDLKSFINKYAIIEGSLEGFLGKIEKIRISIQETKEQIESANSKEINTRRFFTSLFSSIGVAIVVGIASIYLSAVLNTTINNDQREKISSLEKNVSLLQKGYNDTNNRIDSLKIKKIK